MNSVLHWSKPYWLALMVAWRAAGAAGDLDETFDPGSGLNGYVNKVGFQSDGKIIIAGQFTIVAGLVRNNVARLNPDGTGDASFDPGTALAAGPGEFVSLFCMAIQPDGKVLVGGGAYDAFGSLRPLFLRLNSDGSLDRSFNLGSGVGDLVLTILVLADGRIVIGGYFGSVNGVSRQHLARLHADGTVDSEFDPGQIAAGWRFVYALALQPDGRLFIGGGYPGYDLLVRLNSNGNLDPTFSAEPDGVINALALQADGKLLVAGKSLERLNTDGTQDGTFRPLGEFLTDQGIYSMALQGDGKILIGGNFGAFSSAGLRYVARLNTDGTTDESFAPKAEGLGWNSIYVTPHPNGEIFLHGYFDSVAGRTISRLARLHPDGTADLSFSAASGLAKYDPYHSRTILPLPDGGFFATGFWETQNEQRSGIARLTQKGQLDTSFPILPIDGIFLYSTVYHALLRQSDGRILLRTTQRSGEYPEVQTSSRLVRLNSDLSVDRSFSPVDTEVGYAGISGMLLQPDGRILVSGTFSNLNAITRQSIARLNADGKVDSTFDPKHQTPNPYVDEMHLQSDGRIIIAGYEYLLRLCPDGTEDPTFHPDVLRGALGTLAVQNDDKIIVDSWAFDLQTSRSTHQFVRLEKNGNRDFTFNAPTNVVGPIALQSSGKILAGFRSYSEGAISQVGIIRLNSNGAYDSSFNPIVLDGPEEYAGGIMASIDFLPDRTFLLQGWFTSVNGIPRWHAARFFDDTLVITTQPASSTSVVGTSAQFSVNASGSMPLRYRWYKDGVAQRDSAHMSGAQTATLTISPAKFQDGGVYYVSITDDSGSITSQNVTLTVQTPATRRKGHP
jgi:uncharacterized delta-60 repeat protein